MNPQKRNKIIVLSGVIILTLFIISIYFIQRKQSFKAVTLSFYYELCKQEYLNKPQIESERTVALSPQVICKIENNVLTLIPNSKITEAIHTGDSVIMLVNLPLLMNQKYFDALTEYFNQPSVQVPKNNFYLCVSYNPSFATLVGFLNTSNKNNTNNPSCAVFESLDKLTPIGIAAKIPIDTKGDQLGLSIFIPTIVTSSFNGTTLSGNQLQEIMEKKQYFMLYDTMLSIQ